MQAITRFFIATLFIFSVVFVSSLSTPNKALAYSCPYDCNYHMWGWSGSGANGTRGYISTPTVYGVNSTNNNDVARSVWMWGSNNTGWSSSVEAGVSYGLDTYCGTFTAYFHPYGSKDNGGTGNANCGMNLGTGTSYLVSAYHSGSNAHSRVQVGSTILFDVNWGNYTDWAGYDNMAMFEVWGSQSYPTPSWSYDYISGLQWEDSNGNWNNWGYLNPSTDDNSSGCPYASIKLSNNAFQAYKVSGCY